jgi:dihydroorotate dehydrogenase
MNGYAIARPLLFALPSETAHALSIKAMTMSGAVLGPPSAPSTRTAESVELWGRLFPNAIGLAAGADKNAVAIDGLARLGFGLIEVGTVTPRPQPGQPKPRVFHLTHGQALINRMGFPNDGAAVIAARLAQRRWRGPVGVNIGKNTTTPLDCAVDDYVACFRALHSVADYLVLNISSPNTVGLRELQTTDRLEPILSAVLEERQRVSQHGAHRVPLLIKLSPDLGDDELSQVANLVQRFALDGVVATNSTLARDKDPAVHDRHDQEAGGLSGPPLLPKALTTVRALRQILGPTPVIIGVGGVQSSEDALSMRNAGADLLQLYTGLVYRGPSLVTECRGALKHRAGTGESS